MQLQMPGELAEGYKSPSQRTRVVSEAWGKTNLYCPSCDSSTLERSAPNARVLDFLCTSCTSRFELKSHSRPFPRRITDAAYDTMREAIVNGRTPNLFVLHYDSERWEVRNLILIPRFVFSMSCIEMRKPISPTARRHGHVLCNILLGNIPPDVRISMVVEGVPAAPVSVRQQYARLRPLEKLNVDARGWTLDVLNVVRGMGRREFTLAEVYAFEDALRRLHPQNRFVRPKIRQQLQVLRDLGFVEFLGGGRYRT